MGTKFANFHIQTMDREAVAEALQKLCDAAGSMLSHSIRSSASIIDQYLYGRTTEKSSETGSIATFYVSQYSGWSTVLNDHLEWGTVEKIGEMVSSILLKPVMTIGFFDEDIFEFTIFYDGEVKFKKYFCEEWVKEEYDLHSETIDIEYLEKVLGVNQADLTAWLDIRNPEQAVDELSERIEINLWVHSEWMDEDEELEQGFSKWDLNIEGESL